MGLAASRMLRGGDFSEETVFHVLRNRRRRYALHYLKQQSERLSVGELAEQVAAWENDTELEAVTPTERKRVYISLVQSHLHQLEDADMIHFDEDASMVWTTEKTDDLDIYVERVPRNDIQWPEYYLGLSAFTGVFLLAVRAGVYPLTELPDIAWLSFAVALFSVSAIVHHVQYRRNRLGNDGPPPE